MNSRSSTSSARSNINYSSFCGFPGPGNTLRIPDVPPQVPRRPPSRGLRRETLDDIARRIPLDVMRPYFNYPLRQAANAMNISVTTLKRLCRRHGVKRWPHRQISGINRAIRHLENQADCGAADSSLVTDQLRQLHRRRQIIVELAMGDDDQDASTSFAFGAPSCPSSPAASDTDSVDGVGTTMNSSLWPSAPAPGGVLARGGGGGGPPRPPNPPPISSLFGLVGHTPRHNNTHPYMGNVHSHSPLVHTPLGPSPGHGERPPPPTAPMGPAFPPLLVPSVYGLNVTPAQHQFLVDQTRGALIDQQMAELASLEELLFGPSTDGDPANRSLAGAPSSIWPVVPSCPSTVFEEEKNSSRQRHQYQQEQYSGESCSSNGEEIGMPV